MTRLLPVLLVALLATVAAPAHPARAQQVPALTPEQEAVAHDAMSRLRSPVTAFHTVDMCPSAGALRDTIRMEVAAGMTADEIVEGTIARYGEQLRLVPKRTGPGLLAWLAPGLVLVGGAVLIAWWLKRGREEAERFPAPAVQVSDTDRAALTAALRDLEREGEVGA